MKRVIRSVTEPSSKELGDAISKVTGRLKSQYAPFGVRPIYIDKRSANKMSYRITLADNEFIARYNDVDRYEDDRWRVYGIFTPGQVTDSSQLNPKNLYTDEKFHNLDDIMQYLQTQTGNEGPVAIESATGPTKLKVTYMPYERYGGDDVVKTATVSGPDLLSALKKMCDRMTLYLDSEYIEDDEMTAEDVIENIEESNGDGCDYILELTNLTTGEVLLRGDYVPEGEDWDE